MIRTSDLPPEVRARLGITPIPESSPRTMNKTETAYYNRLENFQRCGAVLWFGFEPFSLRLCDGGKRPRMYKPDFAVLFADRRFEIHEIKGHDWEAGILRFDFAANQFPMWTFRMFGHDGGQWITRRVHERTI